MSRVHKLRTWPEPFEATLRGEKAFEVRFDDRGFSVGDELILQEWDPTPPQDAHGYTGRECRRLVIHIEHSRWGLPKGLCVMGIRPVDDGDPK